MAYPTLKIGCCGFRRARSEYFKKFNLVEVQQTFYKPPGINTLEKWQTEAPQGFEFTLKAYQLITHLGDSPTYRRLKKPLTEKEQEECGHFRPTETVLRAYKLTLECAQALNAGLILFQCPARFTPEGENIENFRHFFKTLKRPKGIKFLWEPRGKWPEALILELCQELKLFHVVDPFVNTSVTHGLKYYRIHGRGRKNQKFKLSELKELLMSVDKEEETYVLFNNVYMLDDALAFLKIVKTPK